MKVASQKQPTPFSVFCFYFSFCKNFTQNTVLNSFCFFGTWRIFVKFILIGNAETPWGQGLWPLVQLCRKESSITLQCWVRDTAPALLEMILFMFEISVAKSMYICVGKKDVKSSGQLGIWRITCVLSLKYQPLLRGTEHPKITKISLTA